MERFLEKFECYEPNVAVIGDAYTREEAETYQQIVEELKSENRYKTFVVVPKSRDAFDVLENVTLGVPIGYSDIQAEDLGWHNYRGEDLHLLGAPPDKAYDAIQVLTQPNLADDPPANIRGLDWNGFFRSAFAEPGEYWSPDGWIKDYAGSTRDTVRKSLENIKGFWQENGVWPDTEPRDLYGPAVEEPDELIFMDRGGDPIGGQEELEHAYVEEYEEYGKLAFESLHQKKHFEYYEGLTPV